MRNFYNNSITEYPEMEDFIMEGPSEGSIWVMPLGGVGEIGRNLTVIESVSEIIIVDAGIMFPSEDMPGIDYIIPDIRYLIQKSDKVKAILLTHGHEDHIGALPYVLPKIQVPVYGTELTLELVKARLKERYPSFDGKLIQITPGEKIEFNTFTIGCFPVLHSIAESVGYIIDTPMGRIIHTGDFKFDFEKNEREIVDLIKLANIGDKKVKLLLADSTNAEKSGFSRPESEIRNTIDLIIRESAGRIIISLFASSLPRINAIMKLAIKYGRKICVLGRGIESTVDIARRLGYITVPDSVFVKMEKLPDIADKDLLILATGSQGEPLSALSSMANNTHKWVKIKEGDTVVFSATPIPGNEALVYKSINALITLGAEVIYENTYSGKPNFHVHSSGHGCQEDLKMMVSIVKPEYVLPVHGEPRHLVSHNSLLERIGYTKDKILSARNGMIFEINEKNISHYATIALFDIIVDGYGIGDIGRSVLRERLMLAQDGICIVSGIADIENEVFVQGPYITTKGLVYEKESAELLQEAVDTACDVFDSFEIDTIEELNNMLKAEIRKFFSRKTNRKPAVVSTVLSSDY